MELEKNGVFAKYNIKILGTPIESIIQTEDRKIFAERIGEINEKVAPSAAVYSIQEVNYIFFWIFIDYNTFLNIRFFSQIIILQN